MARDRRGAAAYCSFTAILAKLRPIGSKYRSRSIVLAGCWIPRYHARPAGAWAERQAARSVKLYPKDILADDQFALIDASRPHRFRSWGLFSWRSHGGANAGAWGKAAHVRLSPEWGCKVSQAPRKRSDHFRHILDNVGSHERGSACMDGRGFSENHRWRSNRHCATYWKHLSILAKSRAAAR